MPEFTPATLFGGAITVSLPADFADVSSIRQVPDNQEVYLSRTGLTSIIFDLTERVVDDAALRYHLQDILDDADADRARVRGTSLARVDNLPEDTPVYTLFATIQNQDQAQREERQAQQQTQTLTVILLILVRLVAQRTDVVVSINVPHVCVEENKNNDDDDDDLLGGPQLEEAVRMRDEVLRTLRVRDWSLFDGAGAGAGAREEETGAR
ncbi:MAG: hypothetical protein M1816_006765 [Peltula sp. TS41687]|nr:MAG: hypothetical protein M1816_006765 [Peltula sp. TS41687]